MIESRGSESVVDTDVLIIGGGISGLWAAIRAREYGARVAVVDKGPIGFTSQGFYALANQAALLPEDNLDEWLEELVYLTDGLLEQDVAEAVLKQSLDRIKDYERLGITFRKGATGNYQRSTRMIGLEHFKQLNTDPLGSGGKRMVQSLLKEAERGGVQLMSRIFVADLISQNGRVAGAVGFDIRSGEFYIMKAKAVIIATGEAGFKGIHFAAAFMTGDGMAMAFRAGAELKDLEFHQSWLIPVRGVWDGICYAMSAGAKLINAHGEPLMEKYSPALHSNIDWPYLGQAIALEERDGRGPIYLDHRGMRPEALEMYKRRVGWMEKNLQRLEEAGIKAIDEPQEWAPCVWKTEGIKCDREMRTNVPGLFVGGRAKAFNPGIRPPGWNLCCAAAFGHWAGEHAARYAESTPRLTIDSRLVEGLKRRLYAPLGKAGKEPKEVLAELQRAFFRAEVLLLKNGSDLKRALVNIEKIRDEWVPQMGAGDLHYLMNLREVMNMTLLAELVIRASLARTESRAAHFREDYPHRDDKNWLQWILFSLRDGKLMMKIEPVPLEKYRFQPTRFYSDNFRYPAGTGGAP